MRKKVFIIIIVCLAITGIGKVVYDLYDKGYAFYGDAWQNTLEEALMESADDTIDSMHTLTPKTMLNTVYIDDIVEMTFVSIDDTLVTVTFVTNKNGQYCVWGYTEEVLLDDPTEFLLNGDPNQFILFPFSRYNTTISGWCYSGYTFTINEMTPTKETYIFDCQGKSWSIDYWQIKNFPTKTEVPDLTIEYID